MLGDGLHRKIVASTLCEIRGASDLVHEGKLDEVSTDMALRCINQSLTRSKQCLYGLPVFPGALPHLHNLSKSIKIQIMIDNEQQIGILETYMENTSPKPAPWSVFIKIDVGSRRAGLVTKSPSLPKLIERIESSPAATIHGFYCHAGHSYATRTEEAATAVLQEEIEGLVKAAKFLTDEKPDRQIVVSVGSTPTAHVVSRLQATLPKGMELELHAGCYPSNDLQQVATSLVTPGQQAIRVLADVCSVYPERNEALINAGTVALSKEASDFPGYGTVVDRPQWCVVRMSQEHGILGWAESEQTTRFMQDTGSKSSPGDNIETAFDVGDKVLLYVQHACITAAQHFVYYIVDEQDIVRETWIPWKGW